MTEEELKLIPFYMKSHLAMEDEHTTTYFSEDGRLGFCDHVPFKNDEPHGRAYRHYMINGKVYKTKEKFLDALKDFEL